MEASSIKHHSKCSVEKSHGFRKSQSVVLIVALAASLVESIREWILVWQCNIYNSRGFVQRQHFMESFLLFSMDFSHGNGYEHSHPLYTLTLGSAQVGAEGSFQGGTGMELKELPTAVSST